MSEQCYSKLPLYYNSAYRGDNSRANETLHIYMGYTSNEKQLHSLINSAP